MALAAIIIVSIGGIIMGAINPIILNGPWTQGYALDRHTISSTYVGDNEYGHPIYDTTRSEIGELVYQLKYKGDTNTIDKLMQHVIPFITKEWGIQNTVNLIVPVPPTNQRVVQPVFEISKAISSKLRIFLGLEVLKKTKNQQLKGLDLTDKQRAIENSIVLARKIIKPVSILLVDDLYQSGSTLIAATDVLKADPLVQNVYVLTMTKTRPQ